MKNLYHEAHIVYQPSQQVLFLFQLLDQVPICGMEAANFGLQLLPNLVNLCCFLFNKIKSNAFMWFLL